MKKLIVFMMIIAALFIFAGCGTANSVEVNPEPTSSGRMEYLFRDGASNIDIYYYRDVYTDVVYVFAYRASGYGGGGSFTPLLNADGTPILWSEIQGELK